MTLKYAFIFAGIALIAAFSFYQGTLYSHSKLETRIAQQERAIANADAAALKREKDYDSQLATANAAHASDLAAIDLRVVHVPVYRLRDGQICTPNVSVPAAAVPQTAAGGGIEPRPGSVDIRPGIESFKAKWETVMADCRANLAAWPQ